MNPSKINQLRKIAGLALNVGAAWKSKDKASLVKSMDALTRYMDYVVDTPAGLSFDDIADFDLQDFSLAKNGDAHFTINDKKYEVDFYFESSNEDEAFAHVTAVYEVGVNSKVEDELLIQFIQDRLDTEAYEQAYELYIDKQVGKAEYYGEDR